MGCPNLLEIGIVVVYAELVPEAGHVSGQTRRTKLPDLVCRQTGFEDSLLPRSKHKGMVVPVWRSVFLEYDGLVGLSMLLVSRSRLYRHEADAH
jgi:hypothetical protein